MCLKHTINKALEEFKVNTVLDEVEDSDEANQARKSLKEAIEAQLLSVVTIELIERAMQLTRKSRNNQVIMDLLRREMDDFDEEARLELEALMIIAASAGAIAAANRLDGEPDAIDTPLLLLGVISVIAHIANTSLGFLSRKIEEAKGDLLTPEEAVEFIRSEIPSISETRAEMIIDNEIANVAGRAEFNVFRQSGVQLLVWNTVMDERVCPICAPMDGQERVPNNPFLGGDGSTANHPPIHIRCRCFLTPKKI